MIVIMRRVANKRLMTESKIFTKAFVYRISKIKIFDERVLPFVTV